MVEVDASDTLWHTCPCVYQISRWTIKCANEHDGVTNPCECVLRKHLAGIRWRSQNAESRIGMLQILLTEFVRKACNWMLRHSPYFSVEFVRAMSNCVDVFMHACAHANDRHGYKLNYFHPIQIAPNCGHRCQGSQFHCVRTRPPNAVLPNIPHRTECGQRERERRAETK